MNEKIYEMVWELEEEREVFLDQMHSNELYVCINNVLKVDKENKKIKYKTNFSNQLDRLFTFLFFNAKAINNSNRYTVFTLTDNSIVIITYESYDYKNYEIMM